MEDWNSTNVKENVSKHFCELAVLVANNRSKQIGLRVVAMAGAHFVSFGAFDFILGTSELY